MKRSLYMATLGLVGIVLTVATDHARQQRMDLELHDVA